MAAYNRAMVQTLKGVNLGGWFVLEKWMTPSLFAGTKARNEFELSQSKQGRERIKKHHRSFIAKQDLVWLKQQGVEILRVPIGHWTLGGDGRYVDATERLDWLMDTSLSLGFKVLLDLHAAPGAQNRAEHSGSGNTMINEHSTSWLNDKFAQQETIELLKRVALRYHDSPNLWGIQLLNEPAVDLTGLKLARFYRRAYRAVTKDAKPGTHIVFSDGYAPLRLTNCFWLRAKRGFPVVLDVHIYQVFGKRNKRKTFEQHMRRLRWTRLFLGFLRMQQPVIIGEWSAMLPIATSADKTKRYIDAQRRTFDGSLAQFFWNYKTESDGRWNYRDQAEKELVQ